MVLASDHGDFCLGFIEPSFWILYLLLWDRKCEEFRRGSAWPSQQQKVGKFFMVQKTCDSTVGVEQSWVMGKTDLTSNKCNLFVPQMVCPALVAWWMGQTCRMKDSRSKPVGWKTFLQTQEPWCVRSGGREKEAWQGAIKVSSCDSCLSMLLAGLQRLYARYAITRSHDTVPC